VVLRTPKNQARASTLALPFSFLSSLPPPLPSLAPLSYLHSAPQRLLGGTCHGVCLVQDHYLMSTGREDDLRARGRDGGGEGGREGGDDREGWMSRVSQGEGRACPSIEWSKGCERRSETPPTLTLILTHTFFCANILIRERMTSMPRSSEAFSSSTAAPVGMGRGRTKEKRKAAVKTLQGRE
jgi:hypothetical protein